MTIAPMAINSCNDFFGKILLQKGFKKLKTTPSTEQKVRLTISHCMKGKVTRLNWFYDNAYDVI